MDGKDLILLVVGLALGYYVVGHYIVARKVA